MFFIFLVIAGSVYLYNWEIEQVHEDKYSELESIAKLKIEQITQWRSQIEKDALFLAHNNQFNKIVSDWLSGKNRNKEILNYFDALNHSSEYLNIGIYSPSTKKILFHDSLAPMLNADFNYYGSGIIYSDFYYSGDVTHYDLVIQLDKSASDAVLILKNNPNNYIFNYIQTWPTTSKSSESLLFKKDGEHVLYISRIRNKNLVYENFRVPLFKHLPAAKALSGQLGKIEGTDYRGNAVIAYTQRIPGTEWYFLSKVDKSEFTTPIILQVLLIGFSVLSVLLLFITAFHLYNKSKQNEQLKKEYDLILEKSEVEHKLYESKREVQTLLGNLQGMVYRCLNDENWTILFISDGSYELTGYSTSEMYDNAISFSDMIVEEDRQRVHDIIDEAINFKTNYEIEYRLKDKAGNVKWVWEKGQGIFENNALLYLEGLILDITDHKILENKLSRSELLFRTFFENSSVGKCITDYKDMQRVNKAFHNMLGYTEKEFLTMNFLDVTYEEDIPKSQQIIELMIKGELDTIIYEKRYNHKNGHIIWAEVNKTIQHEPDGSYFFIISVSDITEKKNILEELHRSNRDLEQFAYIASHDLQEPLRMVSSFTQLLERRYKDLLDDKAKSYINYAVEGANRMQRLINDLLSYSRINTQAKEFKQIDMHSIVAEVIIDLQVIIRESNTLITTGELPYVYGDETQLHRLLLNLFNNAIKYRSDENPRITITCEEKPLVWIFCVKDNGIGIEEEYFDKIFQIFQRLHANDKYSGTGIGLAICKRIVQKHGGNIWLRSSLGCGSEFYFSLNKNRSKQIG